MNVDDLTVPYRDGDEGLGVLNCGGRQGGSKEAAGRGRRSKDVGKRSDEGAAVKGGARDEGALGIGLLLEGGSGRKRAQQRGRLGDGDSSSGRRRGGLG